MAGETPRHPISGDDLRLLRVARRVPGSALARHYGVSNQRISNIEGMAAPTAASVARYLAALEAAERDR